MIGVHEEISNAWKACDGGNRQSDSRLLGNWAGWENKRKRNIEANSDDGEEEEVKDRELQQTLLGVSARH